MQKTQTLNFDGVLVSVEFGSGTGPGYAGTAQHIEAPGLPMGDFPVLLDQDYADAGCRSNCRLPFWRRSPRTMNVLVLLPTITKKPGSSASLTMCCQKR